MTHSTKPAAWRSRSRLRVRAYILTYMLPLIPLLVVGSLLLTKGTGAIIRSQRVTLERSGDYAVLNLWIDKLRRDARAASNLLVTPASDDGPARIVLSGAEGRIEYTITEGTINRSGGEEDGAQLTGRWVLRGMVVEVGAGAASSILDVSVVWRREHRHRLEEPMMRFDTSLFVGRSYGS